LDLGDFLDSMRADDIVNELDWLGAILGKKVRMRLEGGEVVFSGSALVRAERDSCFV